MLRPTGLFYFKNLIDIAFLGISQMMDQYDVPFKFIDIDVLVDEQRTKTVPAHQGLLAKYAYFREIGQVLDLPQHLVGKPSGILGPKTGLAAGEKVAELASGLVEPLNPHPGFLPRRRASHPWWRSAQPARRFRSRCRSFSRRFSLPPAFPTDPGQEYHLSLPLWVIKMGSCRSLESWTILS